MYFTFWVVFLLVSMALIGIIMLQPGKIGIGTSTTLFKIAGSSNIITRITAILAICFLVISLILSNLTYQKKQLIESKFQHMKVEQLANPKSLS